MSVRIKDYVIYGWKIPYLEINEDEKFEPYIDAKQWETIIISDDMGGVYTVFGTNVTELDRDFCDNTWEFQDLIFDNNELWEQYRKLFGKIPERIPKLFIFSHVY